MKVIDSSALSKYVNKEPNYDLVANQIRKERCLSLELAMNEVGNSIWKRVLRKEITSETASTVYREFTRAVKIDGLINIVPMDEDLLNASLKLALEEKITIYDSCFIELGHSQVGIDGLVTSDEKQRDIFKKRYPKLGLVYVE